MPGERKPRKPSPKKRAAPARSPKPTLAALEREWRAATTEAQELRIRLLRASADAERWQAEAERWKADAQALGQAFEKMRLEAAEAKAALRDARRKTSENVNVPGTPDAKGDAGLGRRP